MEEIILNTDNRAASYKENIKGWVDRHFNYYGGDERTARYAGSTHTICNEDGCSQTVKKPYTTCTDCREKEGWKRYGLRDVKEWDGETLLFSETADEYFDDCDAIIDYLEEQNEKEDDKEDDFVKVSDLRLVICEPVPYQLIDEGYWEESIPEDGELSDDFKQALENFNKFISEEPIICFSPGKFAIKLKEDGSIQ